MQKDKKVKEKIIAFIASVKDREQQLKIVIESIINQVDLIHLVLNFYEVVPDWVCNKGKIQAHLNPTNRNAHDSVWQFLEAENTVLKIENTKVEQPRGAYYFILDDDLRYPQNYFDKLIATIEAYERKAVVTVHGSNITQPIEDYFSCRTTYGYCDYLAENIYVDMAGCGTMAFHSSTIKPTLQDFRVPFCRDLLFSILCKRNEVSTVSIARPVNWITALVTPGETVYEATKRSENLWFLKNRLLKETLAPLLFCNPRNDKYCLITDYDFNEQLLTKSLQTLACVVDCNRIVFSNKAKDYGLKILTQYITPDEVSIGMAGSKITTHHRFIKGLKDGSKVISADADLFYLKDPFTAFEQDFDIAVTTRPEKYHYPINQGVVMYRVNDNVRGFLDFLSGQIFKRTWLELIEWQNHFNHTGNNWSVGQDMMCVAYLHREEILKDFGVKIVDIGSDYNYCPHADGVHTIAGKAKLMTAYRAKDKTILHLKSRLRELLFVGLLK